MPFVFNPSSKAIIMACGDTGDIYVNIDYENLNDGDKVVFAIFSKFDGEILLTKSANITNGEAHIRLCNHDTRDIAPGNYNQNLRIVTSPVLDQEGNVCVDSCEDDVITIYDNPPAFKLTNGGAYV